MISSLPFRQLLKHNLNHLILEEASWQVLEDVSEYLEIIDRYCELEQYALANDVLYICYEFLDLRGYYSVLVELSEQLISGWQPNLQPEDRSGIARTWFNLGITWEKIEQKSKTKAAYKNARKLYQPMGLDRDLEDCNGAIQDLENDDREQPKKPSLILKIKRKKNQNITLLDRSLFIIN